MTQTELTTFLEIKTALTIGPVLCDITSPHAKRLPVRAVRKFNAAKLNSALSTDEFTSIHYQGTLRGFEVQVLEGWRVPERVYVERK